ncbi:type 1 glutamine amidotransferase [Aliigemmobacter aestuarii]|uniref:Type 1 glutamine amidotransferase n=1 Tax=Aliigemmobacter aestuarii TaxID=1445661 RepID=A0A4S3MLF8_9RHOB|nr:type 1 glutamine amidotransferase [Gemmobacter aestuarii]THD83006.1 type 1 glutamine amidotransferase [Gemmobacter aestuarii]
MRVAIVENTKITHHGQMGVALHEAAAKIAQFTPWADGRLPDVGEHDALVVFGGEQNARADDTHPYLPELARRMAAFTAADKPVMGICLGSQVLARAYGAENHIGTAPEFGWCGVTLTGAGRTDPVMGALPPDFRIFQWHSDTFTLPEGAAHLAHSGTAAHQAFRIGRATYGTQFHFEASRAVVADWNRHFPDLVERLSPGWLSGGHAQAMAAHGTQADAIGLQIARAWVGLI